MFAFTVNKLSVQIIGGATGEARVGATLVKSVTPGAPQVLRECLQQCVQITAQAVSGSGVTSLPPQQIAHCVAWAYRRARRWLNRLWGVVVGCSWSLRLSRPISCRHRIKGRHIFPK